MTYIEPRLGALAFRMSDCPEMPTVCATPASRGRFSRCRAMTLCVRSTEAESGNCTFEQQVALVLLRNEAGRRVDEVPVGPDEKPP